jgi:hypothetical protein
VNSERRAKAKAVIESEKRQYAALLTVVVANATL